MNSSPGALQQYTAHDRLLDGRDLLVRAIRPGDRDDLQDAMHRLSAESAYFRFFRPKHDLSPEELVYFTEIDFHEHVGLVAILHEAGRDLIAGVGRYIVCEHEPLRAAEIAFAVDDAHHGLGIATILLRHLTEIARSTDVGELRATVLAENHKMLEVFSHSGLPQHRRRESGVVEIRFPLSGPTTAA